MSISENQKIRDLPWNFAYDDIQNPQWVIYYLQEMDEPKTPWIGNEISSHWRRAFMAEEIVGVDFEYARTKQLG